MLIALRIKHLEGNIKKDLELLKAYDDALRYERDPLLRMRYSSETEIVRESLAGYQQEYEELKKQVTGELPAGMQSTANLLQQMNTKLDDIQKSQIAMQEELVTLPTTLLARFDTSEQTIISAVVQRLDESQLADVQSILDGIEAQRVPQIEQQEILKAVQQVLSEIKQNKAGLLDSKLANVKKASEGVTDPNIDSSHKLKISIPIIPLILSYESEIGLKSVLNLKNIWQSLKAKVRGKDA